jgi:hypothetical protein
VDSRLRGNDDGRDDLVRTRLQLMDSRFCRNNGERAGYGIWVAPIPA